MTKSVSAVAALFASIEAPTEAVISAFSSDLLVYVTSNNSTLLNLGLSKVSANRRKALNRAYLTALKAVMTVDETSSTVKPLFEGFISKGKGHSFPSAPLGDREALLAVHAEIIEKFSIILNKALERTPVSEEEKKKRQASKLEKKNEEEKSLIQAHIKALNLVPEDRKLSLIAECERVIDSVNDNTIPLEYLEALKIIFKTILIKEGELVPKPKTRKKQVA
jgi:hypothetical protein